MSFRQRAPTMTRWTAQQSQADVAGDVDSQPESDWDAPNPSQPSDTRKVPCFGEISDASQLELNLLERLLNAEEPSSSREAYQEGKPGAELHDGQVRQHHYPQDQPKHHQQEQQHLQHQQRHLQQLQRQQQLQQQHLLLQQQQHMEQMEHLKHGEQLQFQPPQLKWPYTADAVEQNWAEWNEWSAASATWQLQAATDAGSVDCEQSAWDQSVYKSEAPGGDWSTIDGSVTCAETHGQSTAPPSEAPVESACNGAQPAFLAAAAAASSAAFAWGAYMKSMAPPWDCRGTDMGTGAMPLGPALPVPMHHLGVVPQMGIQQAAQGALLQVYLSGQALSPSPWSGVASPICLSTVLDATSAGCSTNATRNVLLSQPSQLPLHPPPPPAPRSLPATIAQILPPAPPDFASNLVIGNASGQAPAAPRVEPLAHTSSFTVAWLPLGANNELQLCVDADSTQLTPQLLQISAQLLPAFAGCDCAQLEEEDLDTRAYPNLVGSAWEDSLFRRSRVSSGQYKGSVALGTGSNGQMRRRACRVAICAAVACLHPEDFQAADAAGEHAQAFMELVAEARLALSKAGPMGVLAEAATMRRQLGLDLPRRAEAPASTAPSTKEDGLPWADPGNPQECMEDPCREPPAWSHSPGNPWQSMMSPRSASGSAAANSGTVAAGRSMANRSNATNNGTLANDRATISNDVAAKPVAAKTAGPWGRPSDEEVFDFIYPFLDIDWDTIEGLEPEVHEA